MRIGVATGYDGNCLYEHLVLANLHEYCRKFGYAMISRFGNWTTPRRENDPCRYWRKHELIREFLPSLDYLLWLDADCLIMDMKPLDHLICEKPMVMTLDGEFLQAGAMFLRNTPEMNDFMRLWYGQLEYANDNLWIIHHGSELLSVLPPKQFLQKNVHFDGGFIVHVPGAAEDHKLQEMERLRFLSKGAA